MPAAAAINRRVMPSRIRESSARPDPRISNMTIAQFKESMQNRGRLREPVILRYQATTLMKYTGISLPEGR